MLITVNGRSCQAQEQLSLAQALRQFSPYGDEAVVCRLNGASYKSVDVNDHIRLQAGDVLEIYPLVIGG